MLHGREFATNIIVDIGDNEAMHIFGGYLSQFDSTAPVTTATSEIVAPGKLTEKGPDMPEKVGWHCMVKLNASTAMYSGGYSYKNTGLYNSTYFYNIQEETFVKGPDMIAGTSPF